MAPSAAEPQVRTGTVVPPGRCVVISGGARGMGLALARRLAAEGTAVGIFDLEGDALAAAVAGVQDGPGRVRGFMVDTADEPGVQKAMDEAVRDLGPIAGALVAAGVRQKAANCLDVDLDEWDRIFRVNTRGAFVFARAAARRMRDTGGGSIVTIASIAATRARLGWVAYSASKAALLQMTRVLALDLAPFGIRVNAVCPSATLTPMLAQAARDEGPQVLRDKVEGSLAEFRPGIPLGRLGTPEEQAAAIAFLLSGESSFITGAALAVDGGVTML
jgi:NAD(P)-dependent dehydrogenase (short-subunit alcohol dehydrogenase family)